MFFVAAGFFIHKLLGSGWNHGTSAER